MPSHQEYRLKLGKASYSIVVYTVKLSPDNPRRFRRKSNLVPARGRLFQIHTLAKWHIFLSNSTE